MIAENSSKTYLDYSATTPLHPEALKTMEPFFKGSFGNPSSIHSFGQAADAAIEEARGKIAKYLNCFPKEVLFTSGGTESDNLALRGIAFQAQKERNANHILISPVEHHAVSHTAKQLASSFGFELEYIPVDEYGRVSASDVASRLRPETACVSVIYANNEIGTINPLEEIGEVCKRQNIPLHTDAVQAGTYLNMDVRSLNVDLLSLGAHKFYGPKGVGALYVRDGLRLLSIQTGGGQEHGLRAGTSNVAYIVGMAKALELAQEERSSHLNHVQGLRDRMIGSILETIPDSQLSGHLTERLPNHASFVFKGVDGNQLLMQLDQLGFACSSGSACKTGNPEASEVLLALGLSDDWALGSLRVTLGTTSTPTEIQNFLDVLPAAIETNRMLQGTLA